MCCPAVQQVTTKAILCTTPQILNLIQTCNTSTKLEYSFKAHTESVPKSSGSGIMVECTDWSTLTRRLGTLVKRCNVCTWLIITLNWSERLQCKLWPYLRLHFVDDRYCSICVSIFFLCSRKEALLISFSINLQSKHPYSDAGTIM